jgi:hypothetical protein
MPSLRKPLLSLLATVTIWHLGAPPLSLAQEEHPKTNQADKSTDQSEPAPKKILRKSKDTQKPNETQKTDGRQKSTGQKQGQTQEQSEKQSQAAAGPQPSKGAYDKMQDSSSARVSTELNQKKHDPTGTGQNTDPPELGKPKPPL